MGAMASAASSIGCLALAEYVCVKRGAKKLSARSPGRADLWVYDPKINRSWSFEAKRIVCRAGIRVPTLRAAMALARRDASRIVHWEANAVFGLVLLVTPEGPPTAGLKANLIAFAKECDFACRLGGGRRTAYLFFSKVR